MDNFAKIIDFAAKYAWAAFVMVAFVLFVPDDAAKQLGIEQIKSNYKGYLWLTLIFTGTLSLGATLSYLDKKVFSVWMQDHREKKKQKAKQRQRIDVLVARLNSLNDRELLWIKCCLFFNEQSLTAKLDDVTAQSLSNKGIVFHGSGNMLNLPFHIPDDVWAYLQSNAHIYLSVEEINDPQFSGLLEDFKRSLYRNHWMG